eukprot:748392-Hanusia_phi.AAC.1
MQFNKKYYVPQHHVSSFAEASLDSHCVSLGRSIAASIRLRRDDEPRSTLTERTSEHEDIAEEVGRTNFF